MLRLTISKSAAAAKAYFTEGLTRVADYYLRGQGIIGRWCGEEDTLERLGLKGEVRKEDFFALLDNIHPQTGETLSFLGATVREVDRAAKGVRARRGGGVTILSLLTIFIFSFFLQFFPSLLPSCSYLLTRKIQ